MKKGFTLLELLVSITILAIGILGLGALFPAAMRSTLLTRQNTQAMEFCQQKTEYLRNLNYEDADLTGGTHTAESLDVKFVREYTVTDDHPAAGMKRVIVTVSWQQMGGAGHLDHEQSITSYISKN